MRQSSLGALLLAAVLGLLLLGAASDGWAARADSALLAGDGEALSARDDEPWVVYRARVGYQDHFNSKGARLRSASGIVRQERANYHRYRIRQDGDEYDPVYSDKSARARLSALLDGAIPQWIVRILADPSETPLIEVRVWRDRASVTIVSR